MTALTRLSLVNRLIVVLITAAVAGFGIVATMMLNQETMPSITAPGAQVQVTVPAAAPDVVESSVTEPMEQALLSVPEVDSVQTQSSSGMVLAYVTWPFEADPVKTEESVRSAVEGVESEFPEGAEVAVLAQSIDDFPVISLAASTTSDSEDLGALLDRELIPELEGVQGVSQVEMNGQREQEVRIDFREDDVEEHDVVLATVAQDLETAAAVTPAGESVIDDRSLAVQVGEAPDAVETIAQTPITTGDGSRIPLSEVADVALADIRQTSLARAGGQDAVTINVMKETTGNVVEVSHGVEEVLDRVAERVGSEVTFTTVSDQAPEIEQSIHDLTVEGGLGLLFAVLVILVFLGSFRSTVVAALSIPLSLLIALIGLWVGGNTLNILTLGALTIAVGRVVDDSIVVIENIRRRQGDSDLTIQDIVDSVRQVAGAITSSTLTTVAVFLPIVFVSGIAGQLFRPFSITVSLALLASLLVALTIVPTLSYWFLRKRPRPLPEKKRQAVDARYRAWHLKQEQRAEQRHERALERAERKNAQREAKRLPHVQPPRREAAMVPTERGEGSGSFDRLQQSVMPAIRTSMRHPWRTIAAAMGIMLVTLVLSAFLRTDLLGTSAQGIILVNQTLPEGTSLEASGEAATEVEEAIMGDPDVDLLSSTIVAATSGSANQFLVTLREDADHDAAKARLDDSLADVQDAGELEVQDIADQLEQDVRIAFEGDDIEALSEAAEALITEAEAIDGVAAASTDLSEEQPVVRVRVDREAAAALGFSQADVGAAVAAALYGQPAGTVTLDGIERDIMIGATHRGASPEEIAALELPVSERQTQLAQEQAADELEAEQDAEAEEQRRQAEEDLDEQIEQAREARDQAREAVEDAREQLGMIRDPGAGPDPAEVLREQEEAAEEGVRQAEEGLRQAEDAIDDLIQAQEDQRQQIQDQEEMADRQEAIADIRGDSITLDTIAEVSEEVTPATITRADGTRQVTLSVTPEEGQLGLVSANVGALVSDAELPDGVSFSIGGASAEMQESFTQLGLALAAAVVLVFLVMVGTFRSLMQPLILLVSVPFAATGAVILMVLTNTALGLPAMIGLLMLIGIVVTNAIVLMDLIDKLRADGQSLEVAILHGTRLRLRPILMTSAATIFALLPMAFGLTGGGAFISQPLAIVVIGGLTSSTMLTLILVPVLYFLAQRGLDRRKERRRPAVARGDRTWERDGEVTQPLPAAGSDRESGTAD